MTNTPFLLASFGSTPKFSKTLCLTAGLLASLGSINHAAEAVFKTDIGKDALFEQWKKIDPKKIIQDYKNNATSNLHLYRAVQWVGEGSRADRLGVVPGCKIYHPGKPADGKFSLHWVDRNGKYTVSPIEQGDDGMENMGYDGKFKRNITSWYLTRGKRDKKWDEMVVAAIQSQQDNVIAADAMWHKAIEMGYQADQLSNLCGMVIAMHRGDYDRAEAFAQAFGSIADNDPQLMHWSEWLQLGAVTGEPKWYLHGYQVAENYAPGTGHGFKLIADHQIKLKQQLGDRPAKSPSELAASKERQSFIRSNSVHTNWKKTFFNGKTNYWLSDCFKLANENGGKNFQSQTGADVDRFMSTIVAPPSIFANKGRDVDIKLGLRITPLTEPSRSRSNFVRELRIGLAAPLSKQSNASFDVMPSDVQILTLCISYQNHFSSKHGDLSLRVASSDTQSRLNIQNNPVKPSVHNPSSLMLDSSIEADKDFTLRFVRVGDQAEVLLDDKRVAITHVPKNRDQSALHMFASGVSVIMTSVEADVLK